MELNIPESSESMCKVAVADYLEHRMDFSSGEDIISSSMDDNAPVNNILQLTCDYVSDQGRNQKNLSEEETFSWTDDSEEWFQISYSGRPLSDDDISQLTYDNASDQRRNQNSSSEEVKISSTYDSTYIEWFKFLYPDRPVIDGIPADDMLEPWLELNEPEVTGASSNNESKTTEASTRKRKKQTHPPTSEMVLESIRNLKKPEGASSMAIRNYMEDNYEIDMKVIRPHLNKFLKTAVEKGTLELVSGVGARGVYKIKNEGELKTKAKKERPKEKKKVSKRKKAKTSTDSRRKKNEKKAKKERRRPKEKKKVSKRKKAKTSTDSRRKKNDYDDDIPPPNSLSETVDSLFTIF